MKEGRNIERKEGKKINRKEGRRRKTNRTKLKNSRMGMKVPG